MISRSADYGINVSFSNNLTISYNNLEAVFLSYSGNIIIVYRNNFYFNNLGENSQSHDSGVRDIFIYNYWNEKTSPDSNNDGIVDNFYSIIGNANNSDPFPQTQPNAILSSEKGTNPSSDIIMSSILFASAVLLASSGIVGSGVFITRKSIPRIKTASFLKKDDEKLSSRSHLITLFLTPIFFIFGQILFSPLVRKLSHSKVLENPIRQQILKILDEREFDHYSSLKSKLNCSFSIFEWHLRVLEDFELIKTIIIGQYKVFFLKYTELDEFKLKIFFSIRSKKALDILEFLVMRSIDFYPIKNISDTLNMSQTTVLYHCSKLESLGLLIKLMRTNNYKIVENKINYITWLFQKHQNTSN